LNDVLLTSVDSSTGNKYYGCSISDSKFNGISVPHSVANTVDPQSSPHNNSLNDVILASVDSDTVNKYDEVSIPHGVANTVDRMPADTAKSSSHSVSLYDDDVILTSVDGSTSN